MDELGAYLAEAWQHRGDGYWWADNQLLLAVLVGVAAGSIGLVFTFAELALKRAMAVPADG